jgi:sec-independent protein translocase protein TatB
MFDVGFWELAVIGVVALLVIGPERLPRVARTAGLWLGRARRFVSSVKADIDRELAADELKKTLAKQAESESLYEIIEDTRESLKPSAGSPADPHNKTNSAVADKSHDANG